MPSVNADLASFKGQRMMPGFYTYSRTDLGVDKIIFYLDDIVLYSSAILFYTH